MSLLVGRTRELGILRAELAMARAATGGAIFVVGDAGIGKSRLLAVFADYALRLGARVLQGRSTELGATEPFRPIAEMLLGLCRQDGSTGNRLTVYHRALGRLVPEWRKPRWPSEADSLVVTAEAVLRVVADAGPSTGTLITIDDLHAADHETLAVVEYLADNLCGQPVLLVATVRTETSVALDLAHNAARRGSARMLELAPLDDIAVSVLAAAHLRTDVNELPVAVTQRLRRDGAGNPFLIEEMLNDMISSGALTVSGGRWHVVAPLPAHAPRSFVRSIGRRVERIGMHGRAVLCVAATLGRRFPVEIVAGVTGLSDQQLRPLIEAGIDAQIIDTEGRTPDWYAFRHSLTAEALLEGVGPATRKALARRAVDVIERCYPDLPDQWCHLAAQLRQVAGEPLAAGRLLLVAGRRAFTEGAAGSAVTLLEQARSLLANNPDEAHQYADALEQLILALLEVGQIDQALALTDEMIESTGLVGPGRQASLHAQLGWVAAVAGRIPDGARQVALANSFLACAPDDVAASAHADMATAHVDLALGGPDSLLSAESTARRAAAAAEKVPLPVVACQAWQLIGLVTRGRDLGESSSCFRRMGAIADKYRLWNWRLWASAYLATNESYAHGTIESLAKVREEARRVGAIAAGYGLDSNLALLSVLRGDFDSAAEIIQSSWSIAIRLQITDIIRQITLARAVLAAHQGRAADLIRARSEFDRWCGTSLTRLPMMLGLGEAVGAFLAEDHDVAFRALVRSNKLQQGDSSLYFLAGRHGLYLLVLAIRGEISLADCEGRLSQAPSHLRWNRQFALLAHAVLLGRAGRVAAATAAAQQAIDAAEPFAMARHLGPRLVAESALQDGWGDPVGWLKDAEWHFHRANVPAVASACRALLRRAGVTVRQHREGRERIPAHLRPTGITVREFEVLELLVRRWRNKDIAQQLHISPRTVEKHIATLIAKTGQPDRTTLIKSMAPTLATS